MQTKQTISVNLEEGRKDDEPLWELPAWGHPISLLVLPLFLCVEDTLFPIGTAFNIGRGLVGITAHHNILEGVKHHRSAHGIRRNDNFSTSHSLSDVAFYLLHQWADSSAEKIRIQLVPLEGYTGAPPTDVGICRPMFSVGTPTLSLPLSFAIPPRGEIVRCIGYSDFQCPEIGISLSRIRDGSFDWRSEYSHRLYVIEGSVKDSFAREFSSAYVGGPCFTVSSLIPHGLSGGPAIDLRGFIRGVNSASATSFFSEPTSIVSLFFPLLFQSFNLGADIGPMRIDSALTILDLIASEHVTTDGSEELVHFREEDGSFFVGARVPIDIASNVHDSFRNLNDGVPSQRESKPVQVVRRRGPKIDRED